MLHACDVACCNMLHSCDVACNMLHSCDMAYCDICDIFKMLHSCDVACCNMLHSCDVAYCDIFLKCCIGVTWLVVRSF